MRQILAFLWIVPLTFLSIFSVVRVPVSALWRPAVGVIEWFHIAAILLALGCLLPDPMAKSSVWLWAAALCGVVLLLTPWVRASFRAPALADQIERSFGTTSLQDKQVTGQEEPLSLRRLWQLNSPKVAVRTFDVQVAPGQTLPLDLYQQASPQAQQPLVVVLHGGAWARGDRTQLPALNHYLALRGITVASISYRLAPQHTYPAQIDDVTAMLRWLQTNASQHHIDPDRIILLGRSAGGHLALLAAYRHVVPGIRGVVALYAAIDMLWSWAHPSNPWVLNTPQTLSDFLGGSPTQKPDAYKQASPYFLVDPQTPPTLLIHGGRDELVSPVQSQRLAELLAQEKVPHALLALPWASHGCEANLFGPSGQLSLFAIERFIQFVRNRPPSKRP